MSYMLEVFSPKSHEKFNFSKKIITVGADKDYDIVCSGLLPFSIIHSDKSFRCVPLEKDTSKKFTGGWNQELSSPAVFQSEQIVFIIHSTFEMPADFKDWDFSKLPQNVSAVDYPEKVLSFLANTLQLDVGGLYLLAEERWKSLAELNLSLDSAHSQQLLDHYLAQMNGTCLYINNDMHTTLFGHTSEMNRFCLLKTEFSENEFIVAYFPIPKGNQFPVGMLQVLFHFLGHALSIHLLMVRHKNAHRFFKLDSEEGMYWGKTGEMRRLKTVVDKIVKSDLAVLIQGETGTGKDILARYIKDKGNHKKLVSVNCAAIPESLLESYLFGHKKGAFTGATQDQVGKIQEANDGILFLDEIAELPLQLQSKLLRVLQDKLITPIGGREMKVNFRLVTATHKNLKDLVQKGKFREDMFYRINEIELTIPPLRERGQDIEVLAAQFLKEVALDNQLADKKISPRVIEKFRDYDWPGNIRELKSLVRKLALLSESSIIEMSDLQGHFKGVGVFDFKLETAKDLFVKNHVKKVLEHTKGNRAQAAELLGISTRTLFRFLEHDTADMESDKKVSSHSLNPSYLMSSNWHNDCSTERT